MIAPEVASKLLDDVIYERVLSFVHLPGIYAFEQELWLALHELGVDEASKLAKQMVDQALARVHDDPRRQFAVKPFGMDCELCEEEARSELAQQRRKPA